MTSDVLAVSVVLPAFNEHAGIVAILDEILAAMAGWEGTWEVLVVDDGSTDPTAEAASQASARVLCRPENGGYGAAIKSGLLAARGRSVVVMDADGSYNPADIPRLLEALIYREAMPSMVVVEYDMVNGVRTVEHGTWPELRRPVKWLIRKLGEWISGRRIPDLNTGLRVFRREVMQRYLWVLPDGFSCSTSMTLALLCNGHSVRYVPIDYRPRVGHSKFRPVRDTATYAATVVRVVMYFRPLRIFFPLALLLGLVAVASGTFHTLHSPTGLHDGDVLLGVFSMMVLVVGLLADLTVAQRRGAG